MSTAAGSSADRKPRDHVRHRTTASNRSQAGLTSVAESSRVWPMKDDSAVRISAATNAALERAMARLAKKAPLSASKKGLLGACVERALPGLVRELERSAT